MNVRAESSTTIVRASPAANPLELALDVFGGGDVQLARQPDRVDVTEELGVHS